MRCYRLLLVFLPVVAWSQQDTARSPAVTFEMIRAAAQEISKAAFAAREHGNVLTQWDTLQRMEAFARSRGPAVHQAWASLALAVAPQIGRYADALRFADIGQEPEADSLGIPDQRRWRIGDAVSSIARVAASHQVVMINEAHHVPQHRAFTLQLLEALWTRGFRYLAIEDLGAQDSTLQQRGYPTAKSGFYMAEPIYGEMVRTALRIGYRLVPYEAGDPNPAVREQGQAEHLVERIFRKDSAAKVIVHAGYAHIDEIGARTGSETMAQRFKKMTGMDPLTIDQTEMSERSVPALEREAYRSIAPKLNRVSVFVNESGGLWSLEPQRNDVTVLHPRTRYIGGRPRWAGLSGRRVPYRVGSGACGRAPRCLLFARAVGEDSTSVPSDQLEVTAGVGATLYLRPGRYTLTTQDAAGQELARRPIRVRQSR